MIEFEHNKDITHLTTFGVPVRTRLFFEYSDLKSLIKVCRTEEFRNSRVFHLGGGSNLLFESDFDGLVLHSAMKGITEYRKNEDTVYVIAENGCVWADLVDYCVEHGLAGLENLAGIPGEAGASPVQNVGAYGVEAADVIYKVECLDIATQKTVVFDASECGFEYRNSNFKHKWKGRYFVLRVSFKLRPGIIAQNTTYGALRNLAARIGHEPTITEVRDEVLAIRNSKLPDPAFIGSAGSFFKNPIVRRKYYEWEMLNFDPSIPCYDVDDIHVKIPAGWLIEHAGLKGKREGGAIVYPDNCLVLANVGDATAQNVSDLAKLVAKEVTRKFHVPLEPEVNFINTDIKVTVLGSGTSKGVPELLCNCAVCDSENPIDKRLRASVLVQTMGLNILIDPSPDFRQQALRADLRHIDAVLVTHEHYDHVGGFDDLRPYCLNSSLKIYLREDVADHLKRRLDYCFADHKYPGVPTFDLKVIPNETFEIDGVKIQPVEVLHGKMPIFGYRFGKFAYITDAKYISEEEKDKLRGLDVLIVNALRQREHFAHFTVDEALQLIEDVKPRQAYLTHLCHEVGQHHQFEQSLPANVAPAYDGQVIIVK